MKQATKKNNKGGEIKSKAASSLVQLLINGGFIIDALNEDGTRQPVKGKFDMMAIESFCDLKQIPGIVVMGEFFKIGMKPTDYAEFILCAIDRVIKREHSGFTKDDVFRWVTEMGGLASNDFYKLIAQGMRMFMKMGADAYDALELTDEEKKIFGISSHLSN